VELAIVQGRKMLPVENILPNPSDADGDLAVVAPGKVQARA
jgi:hypothetical protein